MHVLVVTRHVKVNLTQRLSRVASLDLSNFLADNEKQTVNPLFHTINVIIIIVAYRKMKQDFAFIFIFKSILKTKIALFLLDYFMIDILVF